MSELLDHILTISGFIAVFAGVLLVISRAPFALMMGDATSQGSPPIRSYLVMAAVLVPSLTVIGVYVAGVVCAWRATGTSFYYPWVTLVVGAAAWFLVSWVIGRWFKAASVRPDPHPRDLTRRYAARGTIRDMDSSAIAHELDGVVLDDRLGWCNRLALTPQATPRRKRALPREFFECAHRTFVVHAGCGLPDGWTIERSEIAGEAAGPGGGIQYTFLAPDGEAPSFQPLIDCGFLEEVLNR